MPIIGGRQIGVRGLGFQGAGKPNAPTSVSATDVGTARAYNNGAASVTWSAPSSNGAPITSYTVLSSPGGYTATTSSTSVQVTGLQSSTQYTFTVTATNAVGTSDASSASAAMTATTVPQAPTIGTAADGGTGTTATVTYTAGATGGKAVSVYTATSSPGSFTGTGASPITVSGLTTGTSYTFTVTATNANGTSAASVASNSLAPISPGSFELIDFTSGYVSTATFSSIPQTYETLIIRGALYMESGYQGYPLIRFNGLTGAADYANNFTITYNGGFTNYSNNGNNLSYGQLGYTRPADGNNCWNFEVIIPQYARTDFNKNARVFAARGGNGGSGESVMTFGGFSLAPNGQAITSVTFLTTGGSANFQSTIALYGLKGS